MIVVDPDVTRLKLERELELWHENEETYRRRGWILLGRNELEVDIGFLGRLPIGAQPILAMTACVRIDFTNFDLEPPSVEFINAFTGEYAPPPVQALVDTDEGPRDLVVHSHPDTNRAFFCVPGIRQYHNHPQHSGDSWLLHRETQEGSLATICDRIWRAMARNLLGVQVQLQTLPGQLQIQLRLVNAPGEVAPALWEQARQTEEAARTAQAGAVPPQGLPPEVMAALGIVAPAPPEAPE
ncbi:MAG TPA: putative metal-binding protein [Gaiellaceae bacterium]|nr:putative metal-binding protein [Gaiellaceae bacterium]